MKKIFIWLILVLSFAQAFSQDNDTTQYTYYKFAYGNRLDRYWANKVLMIPKDTIWSKDGLALKAGTLYTGNGIKWSSVASGSGAVDSFMFATRPRLLNTIDSMKIVNDARYVANSGGAKFLGSGPYASRPSAGIGPGFYWPTDTLKMMYTDGSSYSFITEKAGQTFGLHIARKGATGDTLLTIIDDSTFAQAMQRDSSSSCVHHIVNADGSWTWYSTCTATGTAGGDLTDTYPNPTIGANKVTLAKITTGTANTLIGYDGSGNTHEIAASTGITISGNLISSSGGTGTPDSSRYIVSQATHGFVKGDVLARTGSAYVKADTASNIAVGIVGSVTDANTFVLVTSGIFAWTSGLTIGAPQYSSTTAGGMTATSPVVSVPLGMQVSTGTFLVAIKRAVDFSGSAGSTYPLNSQVRADSVTGILQHIKGSGITFNAGDTLVWFGDSYGVGSGTTDASQGIAQLVAARLGAVLNNQSAGGSTIEKRSPTNPFTGINFIDRLTNLPHASAHVKYIVIEGGLNDIGVNSANYTTTNFHTDYDSILHYIGNTLGFTPEQSLVMSPAWIGAAGQTSYAGLSGNTAPTTARAMSFITAAQAEAVSFGTGYFAPYFYQLHDTAHMSADGIHPDNTGYALLEGYMEIATAQRPIFPTSFMQSAAFISSMTPNKPLILGDHSVGSTSTPFYMDLGKTFFPTANAQANLKICLYCDGISTNNSGWAVTPGILESHVFAGGAHDAYIGGVLQTDLVTNGLNFMYGGSAGSTSTATPTFIDLKGSFNPTQGDNALKLYIYHVGGAIAGIGHAANSQYYNVYTAGHHDFYIGGALAATFSPNQLTLDSLAGAKVDFNVNSAGLYIHPTGVTTKLTASTTGAATLNFPLGAKPTSMNQGDFGTASGHLWYHDGSTDYDLLAVSGSSSSGAYVPTVTVGTNITSATGDSTFWTRVGNNVTVYGSMSVTLTAGSNTASNASIQLPVSSHLGTHSLWGGGSTTANSSGTEPICTANITTNTANYGFFSNTTGAMIVYFNFMYIVQ